MKGLSLVAKRRFLNRLVSQPVVMSWSSEGNPHNWSSTRGMVHDHLFVSGSVETHNFDQQLLNEFNGI